MSSAASAVNKHSSPSTSTSPPVVRTGTLQVRERTPFGGKTWKSKAVVLDEQYLTITQPASSRQIRLALSSITELERTDLMAHSLSIKCAGKVYHIAFDSDGVLYTWQDDIYSRCPLGGRTTSPFNFKHRAHVGPEGGTGTFAESNIVSQYEAMMGRSKGAPATTGVESASPVAATRTPTASARRRSHAPAAANKNVNIAGGAYLVKQTGRFTGWSWKERWISLEGDVLSIHTRHTDTSPVYKQIPLSTLSNVERDPKRFNSLLVTTTRRETCIQILFPTDTELYDWQEAIYQQSPLSSLISTPTNFVHGMHVSVDTATGDLKGLPQAWKDRIYSHHTAHIVDLPIQSNGNNGNATRSSRRRSLPVASSSSKASPMYSNLTRLPPPSSSADTQASSPLGDVEAGPALAAPSRSRDAPRFQA